MMLKLYLNVHFRRMITVVRAVGEEHGLLPTNLKILTLNFTFRLDETK